VICTSLAFILSLEVVKRLGAFTTALTINLEPVYTILLAVVILNEDAVLSNSFYVGSILIIAVIFINALLKTKSS
jgi:drug/metabolite transporter (DMT)-like permease